MRVGHFSRALWITGEVPGRCADTLTHVLEHQGGHTTMSTPTIALDGRTARARLVVELGVHRFDLLLHALDRLEVLDGLHLQFYVKCGVSLGGGMRRGGGGTYRP